MTTQKSPESIAEKLIKDWEDVHNIDPNPDDYPLRIDLISRIAAAIKTERENNRLVLPERKIMNFEWGHEHENSSVFGFNRCLDEAIKLNDGRVKPDARYSGQVFISKDACDFTEQFLNYLASIKEGTKYRVEFYKLDEE